MSFKTRHHLTQILTYATLSVMAVGGSLYLYWSFQSTKVLDIKNTPVPVRPQEINPEATVILHYNYCKRSDVHGVVTGAIVSSSTKILLPDAEEITPKTCKEFDVPVIIPGQTTDGVYHLEYTAVYRVNPLKVSVEKWRTQEFTVKHVPPLPEPPVTTFIAPTTNITTTPTQSTTTTDDGKGNTTSTTTNNPPPEQPNVIQQIMNTVNDLLGRL
jgi:hypothetical protein